MIVSVFAGTILAAILCFFSYGAYFTFSKERREMAVAAVNTTPELPDHFIEIYGKVNPGSANSLLHNVITNPHSDCPCKDAAADMAIQMASGEVYKIAQLTFFIESYATQEQCLAFVMNNRYFANNKKGVNEASRYYYNKELQNLNDDEMLELIAMSGNTYYWDKKRFPQELAKRVVGLKKKMKIQ